MREPHPGGRPLNGAGRSRGLVAIACVVAGAVGCATASQSTSLEQAREAYARAESGPAARFAPVDIDRAGRALDRAEDLGVRYPRSDEAQAQAYIALRRAELATAHGNAELAALRRDEAMAASLEVQTQRLAQTRAELREANARMASALASQQQEPEPTVHHDERGDVVTVPGAVLFAHASAEVQPAARATLDRVATLLRSVPERRVRVQGFTDSTGDPGVNERLSLARADVVRKYLASQGVDPARVSVEGLGDRQPVATNATPEGRAANRRVEIVIQPREGATEPMPPVSPPDKPDKPR